MNSIINISFNSLAERLLPPSRRVLNTLSYVIGLQSQVVYNYLLFRFDFLEGSNYPQWSDLASYLENDRITYKFRTYEAITDNLNNNPELGINWRLLNNSVIGIEDQSRYNSQRLSFEGYLNKWFGVNAAPYIYIENNASKANPLYIYNTSEALPSYFYNESESVPFVLGDPYLVADLVQESSVYYVCIQANTGELITDENYWQVYNYSTNESELLSGIDFTVFVPTAIYNTLGTDATQKDASVQSQVDKYKAYGVNNNINTY